MPSDLLTRHWRRLRTSWRYRAAGFGLLVVAFVGFAALGAATDGPPGSHVEDVGVVQRVESDRTTNAESGRITTWWTKEIVVVDSDRAVWTFSARDRKEYAVGDEITVYYDPGDPSATLVTGDHVFHPWFQAAAAIGLGLVFLSMAVVAGLSLVSVLERFGLRAARRRIRGSG